MSEEIADPAFLESQMENKDKENLPEEKERSEGEGAVGSGEMTTEAINGKIGIGYNSDVLFQVEISAYKTVFPSLL